LESIRTTQIDGRITIDRDGNLIDYRIETKLLPQLQTMLQKSAHDWKFQPVLVAGQPVVAETKMRVTLAAQPHGKNYIVKVDNVIFPGGDPKARESDPIPQAVDISPKSLRTPSYPDDLLYVGVEGTVLLYIKVTPDGRVEEVVPFQSSLANVKGADRLLAKAIETMERSPTSAAKGWRFNVVVHNANAKPEDMSVSVPVSYQMWDRKQAQAGIWRTEVRSKRKTPSWLSSDEDEQRIGVSDVADGEVMPLASAFRLVTNVVDMTL